MHMLVFTWEDFARGEGSLLAAEASSGRKGQRQGMLRLLSNVGSATPSPHCHGHLRMKTKSSWESQGSCHSLCALGEVN